MTQEEKELLLVDLCARLPYNIIMNGKLTNNIGRDNIDFVLEPALLAAAIACGCKPYLRPMSSMTDEEKKEYDHRLECMFYDTMYDDAFATDWLNAHHFDYRGLIKKGLALEAPKEMYK
jgi:hypothetical protein